MFRGSRRTAAVLAALLLASPVLAQPGKTPTEKDNQLAGELVKKAIARSQAGDHSAAIDIYLQAYTIVPNVILLSNIAAQFQQSGKLPEALRYFCMYLEKDPKGTNAVYATSQAKALQILLGNKDVDADDVCAPVKPEVKQPRPPRPEPEAEEPQGDTTLKHVGLAAGITGLVALGISGYAAYEGKIISDKINSQPKGVAWPDNIRALQKDGENYNTWAIATLIGGGVLVATGAILFVVSRPNASSEPSHDKADKSIVRVVPTTNGFAVLGTF